MTTDMITVAILADKSGLDAKKVRKILRKSFGGSKDGGYSWKKGSPEVDKILKALKDGKAPTPKTATPAKAPTPKTATPATPKTATPATPKTVDMSVKSQKASTKLANKTIRETGKAPTAEEVNKAVAAAKS
jgi:hypothetical protein